MSFTIRPHRRFRVPVRYNARPSLRVALVWCSGLVALLTTLFLLRSEPVYAEWVLLSKNDQTDMTVYVDPASIRHEGNMAKMWVLKDFKTVRTVAGLSFLSRKDQIECDCAEERFRLLAGTIFLGNMGSGKVVFNDSDESKWNPVAPDSVGQAVWEVACGKQRSGSQLYMVQGEANGRPLPQPPPIPSLTTVAATSPTVLIVQTLVD